MALVSKSIPNLINGVSQQPPALRLESQGELQENGLSDVVNGLQKRPPTQFKKTLVKTSGWTSGALGSNTVALTSTELNTAKIHTYKRSSDEQYTVVLLPHATTPTLLVYDIEGNLRYESGKSSWLADGTTLTVPEVSERVTLDITAAVLTATVVYLTCEDHGLTVGSMDYTNVDVSGITGYSASKPNPNVTALFNVFVQDEDTLAYYGLDWFTTYGAIADTYGVSGTASISFDSALDVPQGIDLTSQADQQTALNAYFAGSDKDIAVTSVSDQTYLINKNKTVAIDKSNERGDNLRPHEAVFYMKQMNYGKTYVYKVAKAVNNFWEGKVKTGDGDPTEDVEGLDTGLFFDTTLGVASLPSNGYVPYSFSYFQSLSYLSTSNLEYERDVGNPFVVVRTKDLTSTDVASQVGFTIHVDDGNGGNDLFAFKDTVATFTSLPKYCVDGFTIQVNGDNQKKEDDFYVRYEGSNASGGWKECAAPSRPTGTPVYHTFDATTMPHTLKQNADLSFSFTTGSWDERKCGDDETNPFPSFVGQTINDVFFHRNRLGFLSDENVIFSEASGYSNFFRVTVRSLLDSDVIDVAVSQNEVSTLKAAVPFQEQLLMFSELTQFTLSADMLLTPSEVSIDTSTKFECNLTAKPVGAGNSVFFSTQSGAFSGIREYLTEEDSIVKNADAITAHVPEYIEGGVRRLVASSNEDMLVALAETDKKECYIYKWYNKDKDRLQSSWSKWVFDKDIVDVSFNNAELYFIFSDGSFEQMSLREGSSTLTYGDSNSIQVGVTNGEATDQNINGTLYDIKGYLSALSLGSTDNDNIDQIGVYKNNTTSKYYLSLSIKTEALSGDNATQPTEAQFFTGITVGGVSYPIAAPFFVDITFNSGDVSYNKREVEITEAQYNAVFNGSTTDVIINIPQSNTTTLKVHEVLLDHRVLLSGVSNDTELNAIFTPTPSTRYVDHKGDVIATGDSDLSTLYTYLAGIHAEGSDDAKANYVYAGEPYTFKYGVSEQVFKPAQGDSSHLARLQLRGITFNYNDTGSFTTTVDSTGRDTQTSVFTGRILGEENNLLGYAAVVDSGSHKVGVQSQAKETTIEITNDTHLPCVFQSAEVESFVTLRSKRI